MRDNMTKLSKIQVRRRLEEARMKLDKIYVYGQLHLTPSDKSKISKMSSEMGTLIRKLK
jgi:hypothetical protein